ncbi:hypothetical protein [Bacillus thuringiensis]|uniref:hypothetical protein n=1 Tax=Bacillus thuringiensis TaxID=1428 RepID=UPI00211D7600|nr:hypothetical protein [Bacillus thuringiensis]
MKKPFYKKWWFWGIIIFFILGITGTHDKKEKEKKNAVKEVTAVNKQELKKEESLEDKVKKAVNKRLGEKNVESVKVSDKPDTENPNEKIVLITAGENSSVTINLTKRGMWKNTIDILKELKDEKNISEIEFNYKFPMIDTYGNKSKEIVMKITLDRETLDKINYDNLPKENLPILAKKYWKHPGFKD